MSITALTPLAEVAEHAERALAAARAAELELEGSPRQARAAELFGHVADVCVFAKRLAFVSEADWAQARRGQ